MNFSGSKNGNYEPYKAYFDKLSTSVRSYKKRQELLETRTGYIRNVRSYKKEQREIMLSTIIQIYVLLYLLKMA
jgi:hypothetical protein